MVDLSRIVGFEWDSGNARKNEHKHGVQQMEAEQVFASEPLIIVSDDEHSGQERRYNALGRTFANRLLHVTFTIRGNGTLLRVISARDMNHKERAIYGE